MYLYNVLCESKSNGVITVGCFILISSRIWTQITDFINVNNLYVTHCINEYVYVAQLQDHSLMMKKTHKYFFSLTDLLMHLIHW